MQPPRPAAPYQSPWAWQPVILGVKSDWWVQITSYT